MELFDTKNILGDIARKNRKSLLLISSISIAYKILEMNITGWSAQGSAWSIGRADLIPWVLAAITLYFLINFLYYMISDFKQWLNLSGEEKQKLNIVFESMQRGDPAQAHETYNSFLKKLFAEDVYVKTQSKIYNSKRINFWIEFSFPFFYTLISIIILIWWN